MASVGEIGQWITENEQLLSGMAAAVALAGVIVSPLGIAARRLLARVKNIPKDGFWP